MILGLGTFVAKPTIVYLFLNWMPNFVRNGIIWVGLSVRQGDTGGKVDTIKDKQSPSQFTTPE